MEKERLLRYRQKAGFIAEKVKSFPKKTDTQIAVDALLYRMQVAVDAAMDVIAMLVKDTGKAVEDDYHNIQALMDAKIIENSLGEQLKRINGLRNAIVHKYNKFEEEEAVSQKANVEKVLLKLLEIVDYEIEA